MTSARSEAAASTNVTSCIPLSESCYFIPAATIVPPTEFEHAIAEATNGTRSRGQQAPTVRKIDDNTFVFSSPTAIPIPTTSDTDTETIIAPVKEFLTFPAPRRFPFAECRVLIGRHVPDDIERRLVAASLDSHPIIAISTDADTMFVPGSAPVVRRRPRHDIGSASLSLDDRHENAMHKLISCLNNAHRDSGSLTSPSASLPLAMAAARTNLELTAVSDRLAVIHSLRSLGSAPKRIRSN